MKMVLKNSDSDQIDPTICLLRIQLPTLKSNGFYDRNSISRSDDAIENDPQSSHLPVAQTSSNNSFDPKRILDPQFDDDSPLISSKSSRNPNRIFQKLSNQSLCSSSSSSFRSDTISLWSSIFFCSIRLKSNWFCEKSIRLKSNQSILIFVIIFILLSSSLQNARATSVIIEIFTLLSPLLNSIRKKKILNIFQDKNLERNLLKQSLEQRKSNKKKKKATFVFKSLLANWFIYELFIPFSVQG